MAGAPVAMADGILHTAVVPDAAAALASPPAAAVLASSVPSPPAPPSLLPLPPSAQDDGTPSLPCELQECIQQMVRERIKRNWTFVRAFECRVSNASCWNGLQVDEWVLFKSLDQGAEQLLVGKVLQLQVAKRFMPQSEYWGPPEFLKVSLYSKVPGTSYFVKWSPVTHTWHDVRPCDLLAVGFSMEPVEQLPLSWPLGLRRPAGRRRLGPAYVMDSGVQAQLSPLGPLTEMVPGPVAE